MPSGQVMQLQVLGLADVDRGLGELPTAFRGQALSRGLLRAARPMVRDAKARAPVGRDPRRRGAKKDRQSGNSVTMGSGRASIRARPQRQSAPTVASVTIGPDARHFYLRFIERGTKSGPRRVHVGYRPSTSENTSRRTVVRKVYVTPVRAVRIAARPFLAPAFAATQGAVIEGARVAIWESIAATASRLRKQAESGKLSGFARRSLFV